MLNTEEAIQAYKLKKCPRCGSSNISEVPGPLLGPQQKTPLPVHSIKIECNQCGENGTAIV